MVRVSKEIEAKILLLSLCMDLFACMCMHIIWLDLRENMILGISVKHMYVFASHNGSLDSD